ncbi:MAG: amino acid dehydrogenase [Ponticaulis sp.]|nr:amino acid dehydrogenase [Ponticaulis sp.]
MFDLPSFDAHEGVHAFHDEATGLRAIIAIHSTALGPAAGGCRMWDYADSQLMMRDALRLSQGMSFKNAMADLPLGGGKAVIWGNSKTDKTPDLFRAFGRAIESLQGKYWTAEDVGLSPKDLAYSREETRYVAGLDEGQAASGDPSPVTAEGVYRGIRAAVNVVFGSDDLDGRTVAVQGVGHVGADVVRKLCAAGAEVMIADIAEQELRALSDETGAKIVPTDEILFQNVDVVSPNALGGIINEVSIGKLNCQIVAGGANNQLYAPDMGDALHQRGILYAPDYVINGGGIINVAAEISGNYDRSWVDAKLDRLGETLKEVFDRSKQSDIATNRIADDMARSRIAAAKG